MTQVLLRHELIARLGGRRAAESAVASGDWQRVLRGAYAPGDAAPDLALRCSAAQRLLPDHARVADRCLLWVLGIDVLPPGPPTLEVVVPAEQVVPRRAGMRVRSTLLPPADCALLGPHRLRILRPGRACADLLRRLPLAEAVVVADAVQRERLQALEQLEGELAAQAGRRGIVQARRVLQLSDARAESPPESRVRLALVLAGFSPVPQHVVHDAAGRFLARLDLAFPELRIAIEYDGREVHEREDVFARDRQRQNALVAAGWVVLRFTAADLRHGAAAVVARVRETVSARAAA